MEGERNAPRGSEGQLSDFSDWLLIEWQRRLKGIKHVLSSRGPDPPMASSS